MRSRGPGNEDERLADFSIFNMAGNLYIQIALYKYDNVR